MQNKIISGISKKCKWLNFKEHKVQRKQTINNYTLHFTKSPKLYFLVKTAYENIP